MGVEIVNKGMKMNEKRWCSLIMLNYRKVPIKLNWHFVSKERMITYRIRGTWSPECCALYSPVIKQGWLGFTRGTWLLLVWPSPMWLRSTAVYQYIPLDPNTYLYIYIYIYHYGSSYSLIVMSHRFPLYPIIIYSYYISIPPYLIGCQNVCSKRVSP